MSKTKEELKKAYKEYIENSPGVDNYARELMLAQQGRIKELEEQNKEMLDALTYFVKRVEDGSIRSKTTYKKYSDLIEKFS